MEEVGKPNISIKAKLDDLKGYFYSRREVPVAVAHWAQSVGELRTICGNQRRGTCFLAEYQGAKWIFSADHCFGSLRDEEKRAGFMAYFTRGGVFIDANQYRKSPLELRKHDVAAIKIEQPLDWLPALRTESAKLHAERYYFDRFFLIGYPSEYLRLNAVVGPVVSVGGLIDIDSSGRDEMTIKFITDTRCEKGISGSPLINSSGVVIGVASEGRCIQSSYLIDAKIAGDKSGCEGSLIGSITRCNRSRTYSALIYR